MHVAVEKEVLSLEGKTLKELRKIWKELMKTEPPPRSGGYLVPRLAYRLQEKEYGGMSRKAEKILDQLADRVEEGKKISSDKLPVEGTEFILEYDGEIHVVLVTKVGLIYGEELFKSPTAVARKITGMSYNGPLLFGMRGGKCQRK